MTPLTSALSSALSKALLHFVWQGLLVAFLLWIALAILQKRSARARYLVSCAALALMTILPAVTAFLSYRAPVAASAFVQRASWSAAAAGPAALPSSDWLSKWIPALEAWAIPFWFAGVLVFGARLILVTGHANRLAREGQNAGAPVAGIISRLASRMRVTRPVRVLISSLAESPSVVGWLRPVILIPAASLLSLSVEQLEAVLAHELAHIRRYDYLVNVLQTLSETLLFYHPAIWWVSSRIRCERELCCDDIAVTVCGDAVGYARALAILERFRITTPNLAMSSTGGQLLFRIRRLTGMRHEQAASKVPALVALALAAICLTFSLQRANGQAPAGAEPVVHRDDIWMDSVKFGDLPIMVRALGSLVSAGTAELKVPESLASLAKLGQSASIEVRRGVIISGTVSRIDPYSSGGTVTVAVTLQTSMPEFTGSEVDGILRVKTLRDVIYVSRPVSAAPNSSYMLFRLDPDGKHATQVKVQFGAMSVNSVQIVEGLQPGDHIVVSDMTKYDGNSRIRLE
jgi:beta-lactamase regulating signal transducer with metallopeptidase domain